MRRLPDVERIVAAIERSMSVERAARCSGGRVGRGAPRSRTLDRRPTAPADQPPRATTAPAATATQKIVVPIMGEGIRTAKVVSLLKKPGDRIELDDPLCEVETDKAVYPIESSFAGHDGRMENGSR